MGRSNFLDNGPPDWLVILVGILNCLLGVAIGWVVTHFVIKLW